MKNKRTYTVISYYWHKEWDKEVSWQTHEGCDWSYVEDVIEHQTGLGYKVKVFEERLEHIDTYEPIEDDDDDDGQPDWEQEWEDLYGPENYITERL
jgi:hypothetical protein